MADTSSSSFSLHSKRTLMEDNNGTISKRSKQQQPPSLVVPAGHVSLRILCHASRIGGFIGKSGSTIKQLQLDTGSKIRVEDSLQSGSDDRVIVIVAGNTPCKRMRLGKPPEEGEEYEVSAAQEAAVRVFEKVSSEIGGVPVVETTSCRLLVEASKAGSVIGKGGKVVEKMRRESGAKIRVLLGDKLPIGVDPSDEVVEIEGDVLAVKKALLGVTGCLQECPQGEKSSIKERRPVEYTPQPTVLDFRIDPPQPRTPLSVATTSLSPALAGRPLSFEAGRPLLFEADNLPNLDKKLQTQDIVFKILCLNDRIGGVIGRGGSIIRALENETGATIKIGASLANCDERLVTITSKEDVESRYSSAQRAVVLVFSRYIEGSSNKDSSVCARLVVPSNQVGCLLGKGGIIVSEMRKATGAGISIIRGDQVPKCASKDDEVVEISGQFVNVQDALYQVTSKLRNNIFPSNITNVPQNRTNTSLLMDTSLYGRVGEPRPIGFAQSSGSTQFIDQQGSTTRQGLDPLLRAHRLDHSYSPGPRTSEIAAGVIPRTYMNLGRGLASANGGVEVSSANRPAIVTNTTVEILVPESAIDSVYGKNGSNLARIRQISGAKVVIHEANPGSRDRTVIISGTPDETQAAQSLLHAFILTWPS